MQGAVELECMLIHLTTHSAYSLQEGLLSPAELVQAAQKQGMPALGLTDHRLLTGAVEFVHACKESNIQPILGLEIDLDTGKLALLATSMEGWSNLCRLSSALALRNNRGSIWGQSKIFSMTDSTLHCKTQQLAFRFPAFLAE